MKSQSEVKPSTSRIAPTQGKKLSRGAKKYVRREKARLRHTLKDEALKQAFENLTKRLYS